MIERILVATDGSELSRTALDKAGELAGSLNGTVTVLHVIPDLHGTIPEAHHSMYLRWYLQEQLRLRQHSQQVLNAALVRLGGVQARGVLREGLGRLIPNVIVDEAEAQRADLIVMSPHPGATPRGFFSVATAQDVLRLARQPVLLLHAPPQPTRPSWWFGTRSSAPAR